MLTEEPVKLLDVVVDREPTREEMRVLHATIKKVSEDIENLRFNTAISAMMSFVNEATRWIDRPRSIMSQFVLLLSPFAPHMAEELWQKLGNGDSLTYQEWPVFNPEYLKEDTVKYVVQVNGKLRGDLTIDINASREAIQEAALSAGRVPAFTEGKSIVKVIVVPNKLVNIVVK